MSAAPLNDPPPDDDPKPAPSAGADRADWLVGPDEGLAAELARSQSNEPIQRPTLLRPDAGVAPPSPVAPTPLHRPAPTAASHPGAVRPDTDSGDGFERGTGHMVWEPGARSVPTLSRERSVRAAPEPTHDFPMDDAEERARAPKTDAEWYGVPEHAVVAPEAFDVSAATVPWWMQVLHTLREDRRIQLLIAGVLVLLATVALWPRGERPMSVSHLRRHAGSMDGADVKVAGTVGQVFAVGGGYAFYLHDGRDTLVVFTRVRHPSPRQHVTVRGTMSTGYLDGQARTALFESNETR